MGLRLTLILVTGETRTLRRSADESPEQALTSLGEWTKTDDGSWVQRSAIAEVEIEREDREAVDIAAEQVQLPSLSDEERAALAGEQSLESVLEGERPVDPV